MIQCSECQSRIRVKNPNLIGRVVSCPKCEAKLTVVPPQQIRVETATGFSADSTAMTKDGIAPEMIPSLQQPEAEGDNADEYRLAEAEAPEFQDVDSILASHTESVQNQEWQDDGPLLPSDEWTSAESTKNRQYLLIAVLGITGIVFAVIAFFAFLNWFGKPDVEVAGDPSSTGQSVASNPETVPPSTEANANANADADVAETDLGDENLTPTDSGTESTETGADSSAENLLPPAGDSSDREFSAEPDQGLVETGSSDEGTFEPNDPFANSESEDMSADDVQEGEDSLLPNPWLQQFAPMLDWQVTPTIDDLGGPPGPAPITAEDMGIKSVAGREPLPAVDLVQKSQVLIPGLIMGDSNLSQAIQMFTQVSGIPTTVNLDSLKAAKIDTSSGYAFGKFQAASVGQVVQQVGAGSGFALTPKQNEFLELRATNEGLRDTLPTAMKVDDLVASDEDREWLLRTLAKLFSKPTDAWRIEGGELSALPGQVDSLAWFEAIRMLEGIRTVQRKESKVEAYADGSIQNRFVLQDDVKALEKVVRQVSLQARPIGQSMSRLSEPEGVQLWIDWPNLASIGVGPSTSGIVVTNDRPLGSILKNYAENFSFVVAIESETDLWITSPLAYRRQGRVYVLPSRGRTAEQWRDQLGFDLTPLNEDGVGELIAVLTPDKSTVIVKCCRPALR